MTLALSCCSDVDSFTRGWLQIDADIVRKSTSLKMIFLSGRNLRTESHGNSSRLAFCMMFGVFHVASLETMCHNVVSG